MCLCVFAFAHMCVLIVKIVFLPICVLIVLSRMVWKGEEVVQEIPKADSNL